MQNNETVLPLIWLIIRRSCDIVLYLLRCDFLYI